MGYHSPGVSVLFEARSEVMELLISLIAGAIGANVAAGLLKNLNLGLLGNSLAGVVGGGLGARIMSVFGPDDFGFANGAPSGLESGLLIGQAILGCVCGVLVMVLVGLVKNRLTR